MLDVPALGKQLINHALMHIAQSEDDSLVLEDSIEILEQCRALVEPTELKGLIAQLEPERDSRILRERDVVRSIMEVQEVRSMM